MTDYNYKEQLEILSDIRIKDGQSLRMDCPFCHGKYTFGITKLNGIMKWGCFRASCKVHGIKDYEQSYNSLKERLSAMYKPQSLLAPLPDPIVSIDNHDEAKEYLISVNSLTAYEQGLVDVRYSPTEDRVLFKVGNDGYVGRSLSGQMPKWRKYGDVSSLFTCGTGEIGVVLEDAPSACAVGIIPQFTGLSILGTALTQKHKLELMKYKELIICLDADASKIAIEFSRKLSGYTKVSVRLLYDDFKYCTTEFIISNVLNRQYS